MTRMEFLKQLEYLLQDIDDKDREDALTYYMDYMDDAGIFESDSVEGLLDAPERIAMTIRSSMNSGDIDKSEFSEQGFFDGRLENERHVPDVYGSSGRKEEKVQEDDWSYAPKQEDWHKEETKPFHEDSDRGNKIGKYILIGILVILAIPLITGIGGTILGFIATIFGILLACLLAAGGCGIGFTIGGVVLFALSIARMVVSVPQGILMMGMSFVLIALGILGIMLAIIIFTKLVPWIIRGIVSLFRRIFRKGGSEA